MAKGFLVVWILAGVLVGGMVLLIVVKSRFSSPPPIQTQPSPTPSPVDESADWKTYTDEKYKFQFQYPQDLYLKQSPKFGDQIFLTQNDIDINEVNEGPFALITIAIWDKDKFQEAGYPRQEQYLKKENMTVDSVDAVKVSGIIPEGEFLAGTYYQEVSFPKKDKIILFLFYEDQSNNMKLLDQILATFKFLN